MVAPIRLDFAASTSQARTEINALAATIDKLQAKMLAATGLQGGSQLGAASILESNLSRANQELNDFGGRRINLNEPIKQTEKLVDNINKGKISWDEYRRASGASSRVVTQQLALQRAEIGNIRRETNGQMIADFKYGDINGTTTALERLAMQARVTGLAGKALGQEWVDAGKNMAFSARQLTISLTAPFVVVSALSMKAYMDTAEALTDIAKVYGDSADGFTKSADQIKSEARDLARTMSDVYAASYADTYEHQKFYAAQGLTGRDLTGSTTQATRLQMLGDVDTEDAQKSVTTLTNVFGVQTEKMGQYIDYMNKIEDSTTLTMQDFAAAMPKMGPIVKSFEDDPKEATKAMAEMLEAGKRGGIQSATEIANAWKSIYTKVARPTEKLKDVWSELGRKNGVADSFMGIVTKNGGDVMAIVKEISSLTADWSDVDKNRLFGQLAGAEQVARMTTFAEQLANSNDTLKEINQTFDEDPGALSDNSRRQQDLIMESAEKRWTQFMNRLRDVGTTIGATVFPPIMSILETAANFVEKVVNGFEKIPGPIQTVLKVMTGFTVVIGPVIGVLGALMQVSGQLFKTWNTGLAGVGNALNKLATGTKSKRLMTVSDKIMERTSAPDFQNEMNLALLKQEETARQASITSLNSFSTAVTKASATLNTMPSAREMAAQRAGGITPAAAEKREARLTPAPPPTQRNVYVPPKPVEPKSNDSEALTRYANEKERHERGKRLKAQADIENAQAMREYKQHEDYRKRVESRYASFSNYMQTTPQEWRDLDYDEFRRETAPRRLQNSDFMRSTQASLNSGVLGTNGRGLIERQRVADQLAYTNRDIAMEKNRRGSVAITDPKWLESEKKIQAAKQEQVRLSNVLKGSTADIAKEAANIEKAYAGTTKSGMQLVRGITPAMRRQNDDFLRTADGTINGQQFIGSRTGLTKSGLYEAGDRNIRRTVRRAVRNDPNAFAAYENDQFAQTNIPMAGRKASGNLVLTPEIYQQANAELRRMERTQDSLTRMQTNITDKSAEYSANIANAMAAAGALTLMFGGDSAIAQTIGGITTGLGLVFSAVPSLAEKAFEKVGLAVAPALNTAKTTMTNIFTGGAEGMASGVVGALQSKFIGFSGWLKANSAALMGWGAAIVAAAGLGYLAFEKMQQQAKDYQKQLDANIGRAKEWSEVLGYAYTEAMPNQGPMGGISDDLKELGNTINEMEGMEATISQLRGRNISSDVDLEAMRVALRPEAIKILASGGTEAEVNKMVKGALVAAGADEATIDDFKLNLNLDNTEEILPASQVQSIKDRIAGNVEDRGAIETSLNWLKGSAANAFTGKWSKEDTDKLRANARFNAPVEQEAKEIFTTYIEALTVAGDEAKPEIAKTIMDSLNVEVEGGPVFQLRAEQMRNDLINQFSEKYGQFNSDPGRDMLKQSDALLQTLITGTGAFNNAQEASDQYQLALKQLADAGIDVDTDTRRMISNVFRTGAGMETLTEKTGVTVSQIDKFADAVVNVPAPPLTLAQMLSDMNKVGQGTEAGINRVRALSDALNNVPPEFSRRWEFYVDLNNPAEVGTQMSELLRGAGQKSKSWGMDFASRSMDNQHQATLDSIRSSGDAALKALEGQQKASEKAMKDQEKALDGKHKAQTKALDRQIKEEEKQFNNQQKAEKKQFDKRQKEDKKLFDKDIDRQKKEFDNRWKVQEDAVKSYYDASRKYLEAQEAAENKLDRTRERNAEAERKRQEMLNDLANKNVDINVAIAGGNLDEAAKLMNDANATAQTYFSNSAQSMSQAESEDRSAARQARLSGLSEQEGIANDVLSQMKETDTEAFNTNIEGQQEAFGEKQDAESETFQEKMDRQQEEFQARLDARKEQLQLEQEQEKEFLNARREAEAEFYAAQREHIQRNTETALKGQEQVHQDRKEKMQLELELLAIGADQNEREVAESAQRLLNTYAKYGVDLGNIGAELEGGMIRNFHAGLDQGTEQIRQDEKWAQVGVDVGSQIAAGVARGLNFTSTDILYMAINGKLPPALQAQYDAASQGNRAPGTTSSRGSGREFRGQGKSSGYAVGGPIFGPGTGTSDSIPAWLSNGEHVLTAAEVRAFGGHAAIEKWRKSLLAGKVSAYATGGGVGVATSGSMADSGLTVTISGTGSGSAIEGGVLSAVSSDVQGLADTFDASLAKTAAPAWQLFGDQLIQVRENAISPTFEAMQQAMANVQAETTNTTAGVMTPAWFLFGQNLQNYKTVAWDYVMQSMQSGLTNLGTATNTAIVGQMIPLWQQGADHIRNMQNSIIDPTMRATREATDATARNFGTAADMIGTGWAKVRENTANPVRFTIDTVFNKGLVGMWNEVADTLELDPMKEHPLTFATGGVLPGYTPGRDVHKFSSPTGGQLHLSGGEAIMRPEWTRAVGGPSAVAQMNSAARSGRLQGGRPTIPGLGYADGPGPVQKFAEGGVVGEGDRKPKWDYSRGPNPAVKGGQSNFAANGSPMTTPIQFAMWDAVRAAFPGVVGTSATRTIMTEGRPDNHNAGKALDLGPSPAIAKWIYDNYMGKGLQELIHMPATGWSNVLSGQRAVWGQNNHYDHVHWAMNSIVSPWTGGVISAAEGGGFASGAAFNPAVAAAVQKFTDEKNKLQEKVAAWSKNAPGGAAAKIPMSVFDNIGSAMDAKMQEAAALLGGTGSVNLGQYGKNAEFYVKEIIAAAKERRLPVEAARIAIATALVESELRMWANPVVPESLKFPHDMVGGDRDSIGLFQQRNEGWGTVAERMNPRASAGRFYNALMKLNWQAMDPGAAAQAVQVSAFPGKYSTRMGEANSWISRVGGFDAIDPNEKFDSGGIARGKGFLNKDVVAPERVLSPQQTKSFDRLVDVIGRNFGSSVKPDTVSSPMTGEDYMSKLTNLDLTNRTSMSDEEYTPKTQEEITKSLAPIFNAFQSFIQQNVVPGVIKYTTELIQMKTDEERLAKVSNDIIAGIEGIHIPSNNEVNMVFGGTVYGDGHLTQIMEDYKRQILAEVRALADEAARRVAGK